MGSLSATILHDPHEEGYIGGEGDAAAYKDYFQWARHFLPVNKRACTHEERPNRIGNEGVVAECAKDANIQSIEKESNRQQIPDEAD
jgi:hypothetical protein